MAESAIPHWVSPGVKIKHKGYSTEYTIKSVSIRNNKVTYTCGTYDYLNTVMVSCRPTSKKKIVCRFCNQKHKRA